MLAPPIAHGAWSMALVLCCLVSLYIIVCTVDYIIQFFNVWMKALSHILAQL